MLHRRLMDGIYAAGGRHAKRAKSVIGMANSVAVKALSTLSKHGTSGLLGAAGAQKHVSQKRLPSQAVAALPLIAPPAGGCVIITRTLRR